MERVGAGRNADGTGRTDRVQLSVWPRCGGSGQKPRRGSRPNSRENIRLALWRIDSMLAPLVAEESVRPWFCYRSFFPAERLDNQLAGGRRRRHVGPLAAARGGLAPRDRLLRVRAGWAADFAAGSHGRRPRLGRAAIRQQPAGPPGEKAAGRGAANSPIAENWRRCSPGIRRSRWKSWSRRYCSRPRSRWRKQKRRVELQQTVGQSAVEYEARNSMVQTNPNMANSAKIPQLANPAEISNSAPASRPASFPRPPPWRRPT